MKFRVLLLTGSLVLGACASTTTTTTTTPSVGSSQANTSSTRFIRVPGSKTLMREAPGNSAPSIQTLRHGVPVTLIEQRGSWAKVREHHFGEVGWVNSGFIVASKTELNPPKKSNPYAAHAIVAGAAAGSALIACSLGGVVGVDCFGSEKASYSGGAKNIDRSPPRGPDNSSSPSSNSSRPATASGPHLVDVRNNGTISGNPSYVVECSWGNKTIIRKGNKWTDDLGYSFSDRTWALDLKSFAERLCRRQM